MCPFRCLDCFCVRLTGNPMRKYRMCWVKGQSRTPHWAGGTFLLFAASDDTHGTNYRLKKKAHWVTLEASFPSSYDICNQLSSTEVNFHWPETTEPLWPLFDLFLEGSFAPGFSSVPLCFQGSSSAKMTSLWTEMDIFPRPRAFTH